MERPAWAPQGIDISVPSVSRMYDFYLGGSHNFEVDREAARKAMEFMTPLGNPQSACSSAVRADTIALSVVGRVGLSV
ncbi:SAM-dependent methyltransferase, partial [Streptomyces sp. NPDC005071]